MSPIDPKSATPTRPPFIERAPHAGPEWDDKVELCTQAVLSPGGPHSVIHISSGVQDFSADIIDESHLLPERAGSGVARLRDDCRSVARLVSHVAADQDQRLEEVRTGRLIRVVLHAEEGAVLCFSVVAGQYVIGFTFSPSSSDHSSTESSQRELSKIPAIASADQVMAKLVDELREQVGLRTQNPGAHHFSDPTPAHQTATSSTDGASPHAEGSQSDPLWELCRDSVDPADLHLVARCRGKDQLFTVDHLADPRVSRFFSLMTVDARRKFYGDFALELCNVVSQLGRLTRSSVGGRLLRLVLDVEQGAIYYYRLQVSGYLVGVTLDQNQVGVADDKMASLALRFRELAQTE